ncbi:MAG: DUF3501 family protein [Thermoplasmatales archaeon]|nr:DUF3501 family protein [Thermoplasmatales archaeon]MCW6169672.1 DUF3501 family protein [Thermoplasmatales archaeon]
MTTNEIYRSEIALPIDYERVREEENRKAISIEKRRRVSTRTFSFLFESRDLVKNQIQEMVYLENMRTNEGISDLIETYADLLPTERTLSVSMFIEFESELQMMRLMKELTGVEDQVYLVFDGTEVKATPELGRSTDTLEATLQYLKFHFDNDALEKFKSCNRCTIEVRRKNYEEIGKLPDNLFAQLKSELR